jgi:TatD DNase family protein
MVTGSDLEESKHAVEIAKAHPSLCYATVGVHPCSAKHFDTHPGGPSELLSALKALAIEAKEAGHAVAFGEIGLDYDRLFLTPKEPQLKYFEAQLAIAIEVQLPLFLHSRAASEDFEKLLTVNLDQLPKRGLVHSFTGTAEEMQRLVDLGFDIGVNGCSMKSEYQRHYVHLLVHLSKFYIRSDAMTLILFSSR